LNTVKFDERGYLLDVYVTGNVWKVEMAWNAWRFRAKYETINISHIF
jgi:hypothetical protein